MTHCSLIALAVTPNNHTMKMPNAIHRPLTQDHYKEPGNPPTPRTSSNRCTVQNPGPGCPELASGVDLELTSLIAATVKGAILSTRDYMHIYIYILYATTHV